jgi:hypothetical protein
MAFIPLRRYGICDPIGAFSNFRRMMRRRGRNGFVPGAYCGIMTAISSLNLLRRRLAQCRPHALVGAASRAA